MALNYDEEGNDIIVYHAGKESVMEGDTLYNPNRHAMLMKVRCDDAAGRYSPMKIK